MSWSSPTPLVFASGVMLGVLRTPSVDPFGDAHFVPDHQIGPCAFAWSSGQSTHGTGGPHDQRNATSFNITAPTGSDVRKGDRLLVPSGVLSTPGAVVMHVLAEPERPANPFTGWQPFVHIYATFYS